MYNTQNYLFDFISAIINYNVLFLVYVELVLETNFIKYYIYHGSYELTYLNQRIRRMSLFIPISVYYLNCLLSWIRHGENQNTILKHGTIPWCPLQLSNRIHIVHSSTIRYTLLLYITPCLSSGRAAKHSPLVVTCYHLNSSNCLVYEHMSPFCIVVTADIIMNVYLSLPLEEP